MKKGRRRRDVVCRIGKRASKGGGRILLFSHPE